MSMRMKVPQIAGVRQSMEVQHGVRGVGRMLRRGLHGAKNWVLELDENGDHRSVWSKAFRALVILLPAWIVLSAVTGGPERGGQPVGVLQSIAGALLVLLVGLAVFSARERRLGREEPWQGPPGGVAIGTESDDGDVRTLVDPAPERPTEILENSQVSEVGAEAETATPVPDSDEAADSSYFDSPKPDEDLHQAIPENANSVEPEGDKEYGGGQDDALQQATPSAILDSNVSNPDDEDDLDVPDFLQKAISDVESSQVGEDVEDLDKVTVQAIYIPPKDAETDVTVSDDGLLADEPTTPLRAPLQEPLDATPSATPSTQVSLKKEAVQQDLQGVLQVQFATPGPYPQEGEPVHEDWWIVPPDIEPEEVEAPPLELVQEDAVAGSPEPLPEPPEQYSEDSRVLVGRHPMPVLMYHASQALKSSFTAEEKDQARSAVIAWLREEVQQERLSRAEGARILGVDGSTVTRWLNDDPWAG